MIFYMDFVRNSRLPPIRASTIDQYLCHVAERLVLLYTIDNSSALRSTRSRFLLTSFRHEDTVGNPLRLHVAIPLSYCLLCDAITIIKDIFATDSAIVAGVTAAFALGYGASLRPGEYSGSATRHVDLDHQCSSSMTHFWFEGFPDPFCVTLPAAFPPLLIPTHFTSLLDRRKNDPRGNGGPIAIARSGARIDCVTLIFNFLRTYSPLPHRPLLSGYHSQIDTDVHIRPVLWALADLHGFPRENMRASSSIRPGRLVQLATNLTLSNSKLATGVHSTVCSLIIAPPFNSRLV